MGIPVMKQIYIQPELQLKLESVTQELGINETEFIIQAIEQMLETERQHTVQAHDDAERARLKAQRAAAWARERAFREEWVSRPDRQPMEPWTRAELYEERLNRYGRQSDG